VDSVLHAHEFVLKDDQLALLSPLARAFRDRFASELGHVPYEESFNDRYELVIPAAHPSVGALWVWDDGDELTIGLGVHHHWHVSLYMYAEEREADRLALAAAGAVESVRDVFEGRTVLRVRRRLGKLVSSTTYLLANAEIAAPSPDDTEYLWDGPRVGRG